MSDNNVVWCLKQKQSMCMIEFDLFVDGVEFVFPTVEIFVDGSDIYTINGKPLVSPNRIKFNSLGIPLGDEEDEKTR